MNVKAVLMAVAWCASLGATWAQEEQRAFRPDSFRVDVTQMLPVSYPPRMVSYGYSLEVRGDSAFVYLPYMGRVYQPVLDDEGLRYAKPLTGLKASRAGRDITRVEFRVRKTPLTYRFSVTAYPDGRADIMLVPGHAQSIAYAGWWAH